MLYNDRLDGAHCEGTSGAGVDLSIPCRIGKLLVSAVKFLRLVYVIEYNEDGKEYVEFNNLTLINFMLKVFGPLHERTLTIVLLGFQILCSCLAFTIRYPLALLFYGEVVA